MRFGVLGPLRVEVGGRPVEVAGRLPRRLLAALVAEAGRTVSVDALVEALWGQSPPPSAVKTVQSYVTRLRAALAAGTGVAGQGPVGSVIVTAAPGYRLAVAGEAVDAWVFADRLARARSAVFQGEVQRAQRLLDEAFGLWRGPPYGEFSDAGFAMAEALRLEELRLSGLETRLEVGLVAGRDGEVVAEAQRLCAAYPLRERFWALLMTGLYRCGRQADALDSFRRVRRVLAEQVGADPGPELRILEQQVLRHDPALRGPVGGTERPRPAVEGSAAAATPAVSRSLPAGTAAFTGREADLQWLLSTATDAPTAVLTIHAVDGMPGVGKTTLAVHAAHALADRFPDGQMFINLHAHTVGQRPVAPVEALAALLAAFGVTAANIPTGADPLAVTEARAAMWRDRLAGKRLLLVLDNAAGYEQIQPLLPGTGGCLVIVTSRRRITELTTRHAAASLPLDTLSPPAAARLFGLIAGRRVGAQDADAVAALVAWCGYLPLAVAMVAGRLRHHPTWTVADLAAEIPAGDRLAAGDDAVAAAFALSYRRLPQARQRLFRRLGLHPGGDIHAHAAAALADTSVREARRHLAALYDEHLLDEPVAGRYRLHDLIRDFTRSLIQSRAEREQAVDRLLAYYARTAAAATQHFDFPRPLPDTDPQRGPRPSEVGTEAAALAWLRVEAANLDACAAHAAGHGLDGHLIRLATAMAPYLMRAGPRDRTLQLHHQALAAADRLGDLPTRAGAAYWIGLAHHANDNFTAAAQALRNALAGFEQLGDAAKQGQTLVLLSWVYRDGGEATAAQDAATRALALYLDLGDRVGEALAVIELANTRLVVDDYPAAAAAYTRAAELSRQTGHRFSRLYSRFALGEVFIRTGDYDAALPLLEQAAAEFHDRHDVFQESWAHHWCGLARRLNGDVAGAAQAQQRAADLLDQLGDHGVARAATLRELGTIQAATGNPTAAARTLQTALDCAERVADRRSLAEVHNATGALLLAQHQPEPALRHHQHALHLAREISSQLEEARALHGSARCASQLHEPDTAVIQLRQALAIYQRIGAPEATAAHHELALAEPVPTPGSSTGPGTRRGSGHCP